MARSLHSPRVAWEEEQEEEEEEEGEGGGAGEEAGGGVGGGAGGGVGGGVGGGAGGGAGGGVGKLTLITVRTEVYIRIVPFSCLWLIPSILPGWLGKLVTMDSLAIQKE